MAIEYPRHQVSVMFGGCQYVTRGETQAEVLESLKSAFPICSTLKKLEDEVNPKNISTGSTITTKTQEVAKIDYPKCAKHDRREGFAASRQEILDYIKECGVDFSTEEKVGKKGAGAGKKFTIVKCNRCGANCLIGETPGKGLYMGDWK